MKIFGINLEIKRVPRQDLTGNIADLYAAVQELSSRQESHFKALEALRKRFERAKIKENGNEDPPAEAFTQVDEQPIKQLKTGDPWPG